MRNYLTFDNKDLRDFGVYITGQGTFRAPARVYDPIKIPNRNGDLLGIEDRLENLEIVYPAFIFTNFKAQVAALRAFLLSHKGYFILRDSYHPNEYRKAYYKGPFDPDVTANNGAGSFDLVFTCKPQRFLDSGDGVVSITPGQAETKTYTGNPASFVAQVGDTITSIEIPLRPSQDLHGYAKPWPAGGGKNLLNTVLIEGVPSDTTFSNATKRTFTVGTFVTKLANNNYYNSGANIQFSVSENLIKVTSSARAYAISIPIVGLTIGEEYVLSCTKTNASNNTASFYKQDGTFISATPSLTVCKFTVPGETYYTLLHFNPSGNNVEATFTDIQLEKGSVPTSYAPYSNICPISGSTGLSVYVGPTQDPDDATEYAVTFPEVLAGSIDPVTGEIKRRPVYNSYNGETLTGPWVSSLDEYAPGATPTIGAQVVDLGGAETTSQTTPITISVLNGINNVWSDNNETVSVDVSTPVPAELINPTLFDAKPLLRVYGTGTLGLASSTITISSADVYTDIDCELMDCYKGSANKNAYVVFSSNDFPVLKPGKTGFTFSGITQVDITPRWFSV